MTLATLSIGCLRVSIALCLRLARTVPHARDGQLKAFLWANVPPKGYRVAKVPNGDDDSGAKRLRLLILEIGKVMGTAMSNEPKIPWYVTVCDEPDQIEYRIVDTQHRSDTPDKQPGMTESPVEAEATGGAPTALEFPGVRAPKPIEILPVEQHGTLVGVVQGLGARARHPII